MSISPDGVGRAQAARPHQLAQHHPRQGRRPAAGIRPPRAAAPSRAAGPSTDGHQQGHARVARDQGVDLARGHHADHGGQAAALVQRRAEDLGQTGARGQHFAQDLFDRRPGPWPAADRPSAPDRPGPSAGRAGRARPLARPPARAGDHAAHDEGPVRRARQPLRRHRPADWLARSGKMPLRPGRDDPLHRLLDQLLIVADQLVRRPGPWPGSRGWRPSGWRAAARRPRPPASRPGRGGAAVRRRSRRCAPASPPAPGRSARGRGGYRGPAGPGSWSARRPASTSRFLRRLGRAPGQDGDAELNSIVSGSRVSLVTRTATARLSRQHLLGGLDGVLAVLGRHHQRPGRRAPSCGYRLRSGRGRPWNRSLRSRRDFRRKALRRSRFLEAQIWRRRPVWP